MKIKTIKNKFQRYVNATIIITILISSYSIGNMLEFDRINFNQFNKYALILLVTMPLLWYTLSKLNIAITRKLFPNK